jgi:hypothetical protein
MLFASGNDRAHAEGFWYHVDIANVLASFAHSLRSANSRTSRFWPVCCDGPVFVLVAKVPTWLFFRNCCSISDEWGNCLLWVSLCLFESLRVPNNVDQHREPRHGVCLHPRHVVRLVAKEIQLRSWEL